MKNYAIIIVDTWDSDRVVNKSLIDLYEQVIQKIQKMILQLPDDSVAIIADYELSGRALHSNIQSLIMDRRINMKCLRSRDRDEVLKYLDEKGITKLCYVGSSMPGCVTDRSVGLKNMPEYFSKSVVIDATIKLTSLETNLADVIHDSYHSSIRMASKYGWDILWTRDFETPNYYY